MCLAVGIVEKSDLQRQIRLPKVPGQIWNMSRDSYPSFFAKCSGRGRRRSAGGNGVPVSSQCALLLTDSAVAHGHLMGIMNVLRAGEYLKVAFVALVAGLR